MTILPISGKCHPYLNFFTSKSSPNLASFFSMSKHRKAPKNCHVVLGIFCCSNGIFFQHKKEEPVNLRQKLYTKPGTNKSLVVSGCKRLAPLSKSHGEVVQFLIQVVQKSHRLTSKRTAKDAQNRGYGTKKNERLVVLKSL